MLNFTVYMYVCIYTKLFSQTLVAQSVSACIARHILEALLSQGELKQ